MRSQARVKMLVLVLAGGALWACGGLDLAETRAGREASVPATGLDRCEASFQDISASAWAGEAVYTLFRLGVFEACAEDPLRFCPDAEVTRGLAARLLLRAKHGGDYEPPPAQGIFSDLAASHALAPWAEQLFHEGITTGCGQSPLRFCPDATVSRRAMAVLLLRAKHGSSYAPPAAQGIFADVSTSSWAAGFVEQLYAEGITTGCAQAPLRYCPDTAVSRRAMAIFLTRTFSLTHDPCDQVSSQYDVVVAGAGTGGVAAAVQAARMGASVLLLEETDWVGGQMTSAGVTAIDDCFEQWPHTISGLFGEFMGRLRLYYQTRAPYAPKAINTAMGGAMEPHVGQLLLREMLDEAGVTLRTGARVASVIMSGQTVAGVRLADDTSISCHVVVDATEHGDVIPLTPARYYVGRSTSDAIDPDSCIQDLTYTAVIRKYPNGVPPDLRIDEKPPGYDQELARFRSRLRVDGYSTGWRRPWSWPRHNRYRSMPDSTNPESYSVDSPYSHITRTGCNDSNDFPGSMISYVNGVKVVTPIGQLSIDYLEDPEYRRTVDCQAKLVTINLLYYVQHEMGETTWSVADDEGYDTPYNLVENSCPNIPASLKAIEARLPQRPYVRESRRIVPVEPLTAEDIYRDPATRHAVKRFPTAVALGTYPVDLHNCSDPEDFDLGDSEPYYQHNDLGQWGPFQIPLEALIPETVDGLVAAEKNIGVSRLVVGATRLHGVTMLTGQAAGATAALAARLGVPPRALRPIDVQEALLDAGSTLALFHFSDVPHSHGFWKHVQLANLYGVMNGYSNTRFGVEDAIDRAQMAVVLARLFDLDTSSPPGASSFADVADGFWARPAIEAIFAAGITGGCAQDPLRYCPDSQVTRGQLAVFVGRGLGLDPTDAPTTPLFEDVDDSHPYFGFVQLVADAGIMTGCAQSPARFCVDEPATRGQAAVVAARVLLMIRE